ncbi:MAG: helix-hairpin-helix domain-containing protein [Polyangiaceae bacterium]
MIGRPQATDVAKRRPVRKALSALVSRARASPWAKPAAKAALAVLALVVLSVIGGSAIGGARASTGPSGVALADAGATPPPVVTLAETVIEAQAPPPPAPTTPPGQAAGAQAPANGAAGKATPENPVSLNTATFEDLRRLPGVGPKKAEAILALRAKIGKFRRPEDLMRVKGIGRGTFKKLRPLVTVTDGQ